MKTQANKAPYLHLLSGGVVVTLLGLCGVAAVIAWMPASTDPASVIIAFAKRPMSPAGPVGAEAPTPPTQAEGDERVGVKCAECGVIESAREIGEFDAGIQRSGGLTRRDQNETAGKQAKAYEVTVRMQDGSRRVFMDATPATWRPRESVIFIEGTGRSDD